VADIIAPANCKTLHRSPQAIGAKVTYLREKGLMERPVRPITPDRKDFDAAKANYCRKHHIDDAQLSARFKADNQLAAELYQLAIAAKTTRLRTFGRAAQGTIQPVSRSSGGGGLPSDPSAVREVSAQPVEQLRAGVSPQAR
jgi:hypothetical protein